MAATLGQLSKHRAAVGIAAVASTAFALFGYDTTIAGGVIALKRLDSDFRPSAALLLTRLKFPSRVQAFNRPDQIC